MYPVIATSTFYLPCPTSRTKYTRDPTYLIFPKFESKPFVIYFGSNKRKLHGGFLLVDISNLFVCVCGGGAPGFSGYVPNSIK